MLALTVTPKSTSSSAQFVDHHVPPKGLEEINQIVAKHLESAARRPTSIMIEFGERLVKRARFQKTSA